MYQKGEVSIMSDYYKENNGDDVIALPHSCDQWIIGGVEEAKQLIADLEEAIKKLK